MIYSNIPLSLYIYIYIYICITHAHAQDCLYNKCVQQQSKAWSLYILFGQGMGMNITAHYRLPRVRHPGFTNIDAAAQHHTQQPHPLMQRWLRPTRTHAHTHTHTHTGMTTLDATMIRQTTFAGDIVKPQQRVLTSSLDAHSTTQQTAQAAPA